MKSRELNNTWTFFLLGSMFLGAYWLGMLSSDDPTRIDQDEKVRGVHYFNRWSEGSSLETLAEHHVRQITLVPYAHQEEYNDPLLVYDRRRRSGYNRDSAYLDLGKRAGKAGLQVIIKPHIWMRSSTGKWRSDIAFNNEEDWLEWSERYSAFILHYASLAQQMNASHFCVGTELASLSQAYPEFWKELIGKVRSVYTGSVFYAANWYKEYDQITFWEDLDYIGVQAYFPLIDEVKPDVETLVKSWKTHLKDMKAFSKQTGKPVLFSELGYKSTHDSAIEPWKWLDHDNVDPGTICLETQANCYEAFFRTFWDEPWFAGVIIWQWRGDHAAGGPDNADFTPQNKPAQYVMSEWFAKGP